MNVAPHLSERSIELLRPVVAKAVERYDHAAGRHAGGYFHLVDFRAQLAEELGLEHPLEDEFCRQVLGKLHYVRSLTGGFLFRMVGSP